MLTSRSVQSMSSRLMASASWQRRHRGQLAYERRSIQLNSPTGAVDSVFVRTGHVSVQPVEHPCEAGYLLFIKAGPQLAVERDGRVA